MSGSLRQAKNVLMRETNRLPGRLDERAMRFLAFVRADQSADCQLRRESAGGRQRDDDDVASDDEPRFRAALERRCDARILVLLLLRLRIVDELAPVRAQRPASGVAFGTDRAEGRVAGVDQRVGESLDRREPRAERASSVRGRSWRVRLRSKPLSPRVARVVGAMEAASVAHHEARVRFAHLHVPGSRAESVAKPRVGHR